MLIFIKENNFYELLILFKSLVLSKNDSLTLLNIEVD